MRWKAQGIDRAKNTGDRQARCHSERPEGPVWEAKNLALPRGASRFAEFILSASEGLRVTMGAGAVPYQELIREKVSESTQYRQKRRAQR